MSEAPGRVVRDAVARALAEDLGELGDLTAALVPAGATAVADFVVRADGVLAGSACATETFRQLDAEVSVRWSAADGDLVGKGQAVGRVEGPLRPVLTGERTALNFLCHLSGVATLTRRFVDAVEQVGGPRRTRVWDTRKTLPGLRALEKAAVRAGGGVNHRGSLSDMVLVKDNHLGGTTIRAAVARARELWPGRGVEVECDRAAQVAEALAAGADLVMLDNMAPSAVAECVALVRASARPETLVEVSGGVTLETVAAYAAAGADLVSTSVITQSAPALDIGLDLALE
ncbi:MAG TPA: carboxylating nicotinate-nucleotide diphosphorylase [Acidimicrobiia bacterium]|nr:carboxylating nicotinate-nucleotide diphosphorylase [Acidimicrobiia bacterium]